jgi:hypothetical protein
MATRTQILSRLEELRADDPAAVDNEDSEEAAGPSS